MSLRTFLALVAVAGLACGWVGPKVQQARAQRQAVERILELGGSVSYDIEAEFDPYGPPSEKGWLRKLLGDDFFSKVTHVNLNGDAVTDADMCVFQHLPELTALDSARQRSAMKV